MKKAIIFLTLIVFLLSVIIASWMVFTVFSTPSDTIHSRTSLIKRIQVADAKGNAFYLYVFQTDIKCRKPFDAAIDIHFEIHSNDSPPQGGSTPEIRILSNKGLIYNLRAFVYLTSDGRYAFSSEKIPEKISWQEVEKLCDKRLPVSNNETDLKWKLSMNYPPYIYNDLIHPFDHSSSGIIRGTDENDTSQSYASVFLGMKSVQQ